VGVEGGADLVDLGAVDADGFVEDLGGDVELVGPVGHVGGDFGVDGVGVVRSLGVVFVGGVGFWFLGLLFVLYRIMFGHGGASCTGKKDVHGTAGDVLEGVWVVRRKAIPSLRLRVHSSLRQELYPTHDAKARHGWGTRVLRARRLLRVGRGLQVGCNLGDVLGGFVGVGGVLVGTGGVLVGLGGVLGCFFVVAGLVVLGCGVVGFGGFFVMMGCGLVSFVCHGGSPVTGLSGVGDARAGCVSLA